MVSPAIAIVPIIAATTATRSHQTHSSTEKPVSDTVYHEPPSGFGVGVALLAALFLGFIYLIIKAD